MRWNEKYKTRIIALPAADADVWASDLSRKPEMSWWLASWSFYVWRHERLSYGNLFRQGFNKSRTQENARIKIWDYLGHLCAVNSGKKPQCWRIMGAQNKQKIMRAQLRRNFIIPTMTNASTNFIMQTEAKRWETYPLDDTTVPRS